MLSWLQWGPSSHAVDSMVGSPSVLSRQEAWPPEATVTEQGCLLLGRFVERAALILKEAQIATTADNQGAGKLFSSICEEPVLFIRRYKSEPVSLWHDRLELTHGCAFANALTAGSCTGDLARAVQGCSQFLEALNSRGRLELILASPTISMDLQDKLLDLADGVAALQRCQCKVRLLARCCIFRAWCPGCWALARTAVPWLWKLPSGCLRRSTLEASLAVAGCS